jgi:hypothetical protein
MTRHAVGNPIDQNRDIWPHDKRPKTSCVIFFLLLRETNYSAVACAASNLLAAMRPLHRGMRTTVYLMSSASPSLRSSCSAAVSP